MGSTLRKVEFLSLSNCEHETIGFFVLFKHIVRKMPSDNSSTLANNTLSVFRDHVKQVFSTIPPVTKFALYAPFVILILDEIFFPLMHINLSISDWTYLDYEKSVLGFQGTSAITWFTMKLQYIFNSYQFQCIAFYYTLFLVII
jgi:hypothetical protein